MITGDNPCYECGKQIIAGRYQVEVYEAAGRMKMRMAGDQVPNTSDLGYMGWYPVGPDCARKLRKKGVLVITK